MENLKFRAWDKEEKIMKEVFNLDFHRYTAVVGFRLSEPKSFLSDDPLIIMQYTGLKDKNGVEIFEGDIVKDINGEIGYIAFLKQEMGYVIVYKNRDRQLGHRNGIEDHDLEVIGNIYENGDLL